MKLHNRIWHWATAVLIFMLLFLLLLTKTIFSPGANKKAIQETLENALHPSDKQTSSTDTASTQPTSTQPTSTQPASNQPASNQPASNQPASNQTASTEPTSSQIISSHPNQNDSTGGTFSDASNSVKTIKFDPDDLKDLSKLVAKIYSHKFWDLHFYLGISLAFLMLYRVFQIFVFEKRLVLSNPDFNKIQKWAYFLFYLSIGFLTLSGIFIRFTKDLEQYKDLRHTLKDVHGNIMYVILAFIIVHFAGLIKKELSK